MFLIAGVQPRTRKGPKTDQICPRCGLAQVYEKRVDHYLSLFFIPLVRVRKGEGISWCERCEQPLARKGGGTDTRDESFSNIIVCKGCGEILDSKFRFCPHCGRSVE